MKTYILLLFTLVVTVSYGQSNEPTYKLIIPGTGNIPTAILISEPRRGYYLGKDTGQLAYQILWKSPKRDTVIIGYADYKNKPLKKGVFKMK